MRRGEGSQRWPVVSLWTQLLCVHTSKGRGIHPCWYKSLSHGCLHTASTKMEHWGHRISCVWSHCDVSWHSSRIENYSLNSAKFSFSMNGDYRRSTWRIYRLEWGCKYGISTGQINNWTEAFDRVHNTDRLTGGTDHYHVSATRKTLSVHLLHDASVKTYLQAD